MHQHFPVQDASGDYILPSSMQNVYLSPPSRHILPSVENTYKSPTGHQPTSYNDRINPMATPPFQNIVTSAYKNQLNTDNNRAIDKEQGRKINVNLVEKGESHGQMTLFLRIQTPLNINPGCKERLQILLTGQYRGK